VSVSVFGGLVGSRLTSLVELPKKCNSWQLARALRQSGWWDEVRAELGEGEVRVQLDNAPIHTGPGMREFRMAEPEFGRAVTFQPPYSPDLNPIEHVWARMKRVLRERVFSSADSLRVAVREAWELTARDTEFLRGLTQSMPRRLNAVVEADGGPTRY